MACPAKPEGNLLKIAINPAPAGPPAALNSCYTAASGRAAAAPLKSKKPTPRTKA